MENLSTLERGPVSARSGPRAFRVVTWIFLVTVIALLAFGLAHRSTSPDVLGRYSLGYSAVLAGLVVIAGLLVFILVRPYGAIAEGSKNLYTLVIATAITVAAAEAGLRLFAPWGIDFFHWLPYHMQGMVDDPDLGYVHPTSVSFRLGDVTVRLNSHGLRDDEITYEKPPGAPRILVLGDSVAFGWGVDQGESFPDRMEFLLRERTGEPWQVINAGVNGYNSEQQAAFLELRGWRYGPDIVVLVFVDNDVDVRVIPNQATWRRYPDWPSSLPEAVDRLRQLSYLNQLTHVMARLQPVVESGEERSITDHPRWPHAHAALRRIAQACRDRGVPLVVAHLSGDRAFAAALERDRIAVVSLGPAWARVAPERQRVSRVDPHPTAPVHGEFAALLVNEVAARGWVAQ